MFRASPDDLNCTTLHLRMSDFGHVFLDKSFPDEEFNSKKMIISSKLCEKKIGDRVRLGENDLLFLWQA